MSEPNEKKRAIGAWRRSQARVSYREMLRPNMIGLSIGMAGAAVGIFTITGPLGTYDTLAPLQRLVYFGLLACLMWPMFYSKLVVTLYFTRSCPPLVIAPALAMTMMIAAVPCTAVAYSFQSMFGVEASARAGLAAIYLMTAATAVSLNCLLFLQVIRRSPDRPGTRTMGDRSDEPEAAAEQVTSGVESASSAADGRGRSAQRRRRQTHRLPGGVAPESLFDRLPGELGRDVIYLKIDDHYVETHTTSGSGSALMRFSDAIDEVADQGMRVHRSYWAAHAHMVALVRRDGRAMLQLTGGHEVPVSRTYLPSVRAAVQAKWAAAPEGATRESDEAAEPA